MKPTATNLEVQLGDYDLLGYCTFRLAVANDAQNIRVDTGCTKDHDKRIL